MTDKWKGKVAVVTGTSSGVGAAILKDFAKNGLIVIGLARRVERVEKNIEELGDTGANAYAYKCDVSNLDSVKEAFKWIEEKFNVVHILVNNAAIGANIKLLDSSDRSREKINEILDTNVRGLVDCTREAYRLMKKSNEHGMIVNINSTVGHTLPFFGFSMNMYAPTKYAVTALTEIIRQELIIEKNDKVRISSVSPGYIKTDFQYASEYDYDSSEWPYLTSEDVSHAVMYLLTTSYKVNITELTLRPTGENF